MQEKGPGVLSKVVMNAIALIVTAVWAGSFIAQYFTDVKPDPQINLIFGSVIAGAFALPKLLGSKDKEEIPPARHRSDG